MPIEVRFASQDVESQGKVLGAITPVAPGSFRDYNINAPSLISAVCSDDETSGQIYRFRDTNFLSNPHIRIIPADLYTEENLEATLQEPGERYESPLIAKNGQAARLILTLLST